MKYQVRVIRGQKADRLVHAIDEEDAARKVQEELDRPHGFIGPDETPTATLDGSQRAFHVPFRWLSLV